MQKHIILLPEVVAKETEDCLIAGGCNIKRGRGLDRATLIDDLQGCAAVIVRVACIDHEVMETCPELKVIAKHGVGYDNININAAQLMGKRVTYTPYANTLSVAELTFTLILACARRLPMLLDAYRAGEYVQKDAFGAIEIRGKLLGLVGLGRIAREVAYMARMGFGMQVCAFDPFTSNTQWPQDVTKINTLEELFGISDFISLHIPGTPENKKLINAHAFQLMKPTAYLINTARGTIIDTDALVNALKNGAFAGAALDVCDPEPYPKDGELFNLPQVILTPHCGAATEDAMVRMGVTAAEDILSVLNGCEPKYPIV